MSAALHIKKLYVLDSSMILLLLLFAIFVLIVYACCLYNDFILENICNDPQNIAGSSKKIYFLSLVWLWLDNRGEQFSPSISSISINAGIDIGSILA